MMKIVGSSSKQHFIEQMVVFFQEMSQRCYISETSSILDIGCGCGRMAIPFSLLQSTGKYYGFDVWGEGIEWCQKNISSKRQDAHFFKVEAKNNYYFDERSKEENAFDLQPVPSDSIDVAFAISVFNHLVRKDCQSYIKEIARTLKKSGVAYITCFIIDRFFNDYVSTTENYKAVYKEEPGCFYGYKGQDFFAGYAYSTWRSMLEQAGLDIISFEPGRWVNKPGGRMFEDTFVVTKKGTSDSNISTEHAHHVIHEFFPELWAETANYLVNFSASWRYLYVETPKVGCSTIKLALQKMESGNDVVSKDSIHDRDLSPLASPQTDLPGFLLAQYSPNYLRFSFVRNPFSRIVSCYIDKCVKGTDKERLMPKLGLNSTDHISLKDFLLAIQRQPYRDMDIHWLPQAVILDGLRKPRYIGRFENFNSDLRRVLSLISGHAVEEIERHDPHATKASEQVLQLVGSEERNLIVEIYKRDFIEYCYSMDPRFAV